jgi:hypothetical protein
VQFSDTLASSFTDVVRPFSTEFVAAQSGLATNQTFTDDFTLTGGAPAQGQRYHRIKIVQ